ncbi:MAG: DUF4834 family protein [Bacteroidales bacterium]|jgi:hypothetical protein|nr:DUF4834 family protein [Bacteroidales bacterium]MDD3701313.1 DUF4834 family protein [Bacteroidales bacterium]MDY0370544.1 DUF4834 family protein [Bacteroidales bacterium]
MERLFLLVFWIIISFYAIRIGFRYFLPWLIKRKVRKMGDHFRNTTDPQAHNQKSSKQNDVTIQYTSKQRSVIDPDIGEYVDFEEINEPNSPEHHE